MTNHKPCPFCGRRDLDIKILYSGYDNCRIRCLHCKTEGPEACHDLAAWEAWDRRECK